MNKLHDYLASKLSWYKKWHEQPVHKETHWVAFIVFTVVVMGGSAQIMSNLIIDEQISPESSLAAVAVGGIHINKNLSSNQYQTKVKPPFPTIALSKAVRSDEAITALGDKLSDVAAWYGNTADELKNFLKKDKDLWVDKKGRLLYLDEGMVAQGTIAGSEPQGAAPISGPFSLDQTFFLHSNPGSSKVLYLDFNGATVTNTVWNSNYNNGQTINALAFSLDSDRATFNNSELQMIQNIWFRVTEDYAPFDVDVTTEEPTAGYLNRSYTNTVVITPTNFYPNAGGVSYVGVFDDSSPSYKYSWAFSNMLQNSEKYIGEAVSHESGHAFGLHHEGTTAGVTYYQGQGNWAPIMGNSYYKPVTQWAKGEYTGANNAEDQIQVMQNYGLRFYPDDHSNTTSVAGVLSVNTDGTVHGQGVAEQRSDVDVFKFAAGAGLVNLSLTSAIPSGAGDLNIKAELKDSAGTVLASSDPSGLSASISATAAGGTYYLSISGVGEADPLTTGYSDYASLGQYFINGTVVYDPSIVFDEPNQPPTAIISATPLSGGFPLNVNFNGYSSSDPDGTIASYYWDYGDSSTGTGASSSHIYLAAGTYTAQLTVTDNDGDQSSVTTAISVSDPNIIQAPSNLRSSLSGSTITLNWNDNSTNESGFYIERAPKGKGGAQTYTQVGQVGSNVKTYTETVAVGTYYYRVRAFGSIGNTSTYSNAIQVQRRK